MMPNSILPTAIAAISLASISVASAAISILGGSGSGTFDASSGSSLPATMLSSFDASSASKVVVTISGEDGFGDSLPTGVSFNGDSFTLAVTDTNAIQQTWIYYLDASDAGGTFGTGNLVIDGSGSDDFAASWLFLSGTADGVGATNSAQSQTVSLTTTANDSFVVASHANNGSSGTAQSPLTVLLDGPAGSAGGGSGYATIATAGAGTYEFTGGSSRPVTVAAEFTVIPEPSIALLGGLGVLGLLRRRRA
ncbi:hypothetical protein [Haloferula sp. A504]|uniref:hypothetical protein n=1 Tax=Haloferula sp. A504 TaxID=3373601 RepID=UPI0031C90EA3|nr:hypothetical protein [Verrucomicrobiaceae bacterium E54]